MGFKRRPVDLYILVALATFSLSWSILTGQGTPVAIVLVIFSPGYMIAAAIYPRASDLKWELRIMLSVVLSLAAISIIAVFLDFSPWGARPAIVEIATAAFVMVIGFLAYFRRNKLPLENRISLSIEIFRPRWRVLGAAGKMLSIALALSVAAAFGLVAYIVTTTPPVERFTEFYILGAGQNASEYPNKIRATQVASVILGITNHEYDPYNYSIDIDLVGVTISYNVTTGQNETVPVNFTRWSSFTMVLDNGQTWRMPFTFHIDSVGLWEIQFLLYRGDNLGEAYHELRLIVTVT